LNQLSLKRISHFRQPICACPQRNANPLQRSVFPLSPLTDQCATSCLWCSVPFVMKHPHDRNRVVCQRSEFSLIFWPGYVGIVRPAEQRVRCGGSLTTMTGRRASQDHLALASIVTVKGTAPAPLGLFAIPFALCQPICHHRRVVSVSQNLRGDCAVGCAHREGNASDNFVKILVAERLARRRCSE